MPIRPKIPRKVSAGKDVRAEDINALISCVEHSRAEIQSIMLRPSNDIAVSRSANGTTAKLKSRIRNPKISPKRFEFLGLVRKAGQYYVKIAPGVVVYNEIRNVELFTPEKAPEAKTVVGVFPYIEVDGDDVRIDDSSVPMLALGSQSDGAVWLICEDSQCYSSTTGKERLELTPRNDLPEAEKGEICVLIAQFDVETEGGAKKATNVYKFLQSDHQQPFLCGGDDDSSLQSEGSSFPDSEESSSGDSSDDSAMSDDGSMDSGSSDEESEGSCRVAMRAVWTNEVGCFPVDTTIFDAGSCFPKSFSFRINVRFYLKNPYPGRTCKGWAFGVSVTGGRIIDPPPGSTDNEYRWRNDWARTLVFQVDNPPVCGYLVLSWRVRSFVRAPGFGGASLSGESCCDKIFTGVERLLSGVPYAYNKLPPVCGPCSCSSALGSDSTPSGV